MDEQRLALGEQTPNDYAVFMQTGLLRKETDFRICARILAAGRAARLARYVGKAEKNGNNRLFHDARVASRRLREALRILKPWLPSGDFDCLYSKARSAARSLRQANDEGIARDYLVETLEKSRSVAEKLALRDLTRWLDRRQKEGKIKTRKAFRKLRLRKVLAAIGQSVRSPCKGVGGIRFCSAVEMSRKILDERIREVMKRRRAVRGEDDGERLHRLRMTIKRLRYAVEMLGFAGVPRLRRNQRFLKRLQTCLGEMHDREEFAVLARKRLEKLRRRSDDGLLLKGYGLLLSRLARERRSCHAAYARLFDRPSLREWRARFMPDSKAKSGIAKGFLLTRSREKDFCGELAAFEQEFLKQRDGIGFAAFGGVEQGKVDGQGMSLALQRLLHHLNHRPPAMDAHQNNKTWHEITILPGRMGVD
ncbi:MAG: CHAD domain-containing protein [Verrucomicrobiae bacterium]|nr:CHAD domain-containing protein [Verrucomicrobiae bacterium]